MTRTRPARPTSLRLECLEDRSVAATFNVTTTLDVVDPADGKRSLREAITAANNRPGADVIVIPAGVFKIALSGANEDGNTTGDFDITDAVTIRGAGKGLTFIDGQQLDRAFDITGSAPGSIKVILERVTVRNGRVTGDGGGIEVLDANLVVRDAAVVGNLATSSGGGVGGAIGIEDLKVVRTTVARNVANNGGGIGFLSTVGTLTVRESSIRRNIASSAGGGINAVTATLTDSTVSGNSAGGNGGGINATTTATLIGCTVSGNSATFQGGGVRAFTAATLTNCTVSGNSAGTNGGGIWAGTATLSGCTVSGNATEFSGGGINADTATLTRSTVSGNAAALDGGGINAITAATLTNSTVSGNTADADGGGVRAFFTTTLTNSTVSGNTAFSGGGISAGTATLTNSTVSGNTADADGGGILAGAATLSSCTVVENLALTGGGLFHDPIGTFNLRNTIVALNMVLFGGTGPDVSGVFASQGHNLIGDGTGGIGFTGTDLVGTNLDPIDPLLGPLANNGGKTKTHRLLAGSPAIDAGDNVSLPPTDQRGGGFPRKKDGNFDGRAVVDIGAFER